MNPAVDITLILPAFNEAKVIRNTIEEAVSYLRSRGLSYQIIVAADGDDGTREIVREMGKADSAITTIGSPQRSGKGRGIRNAVEIATGQVIGYADADNKVPIDELDKLLPLIQKDGYAVAFGSRALAKSSIERKQPLYRQIGSKGFYLFLKLVVGLDGIRDTQCGFKMFSRQGAKCIFGLQKVDGYMFDVEILLLAKRLGLKMIEVPIRWHDDADSRLDLISGNLRNVKDVIGIRFSLPRAGEDGRTKSK
jgi:dolichyl-phosphate beta-glucosyltransferase